MQKIIMGTLLTYTMAISGVDITPVAEEKVYDQVAVEDSSSWKHSISIYGWLPSLDGTLKYTIPGDPDDPNDPDQDKESSLADKIDLVLMGSYEVRKDKWSFFADAIYLAMSDAQNVSWEVPLSDRTVTVGSEQDLDAWLVSMYGGYNILETDTASIDLIGGMRYLSLEVGISIDLLDRTPSISPSIELYDGVIGLKGHMDLSQNWYLPYMFDIGAGDSDLTWQAQASVGYRFSWGDLLATYRYVHYEKDDLRLIKDLDLYGPKLGLVFHF